MSKPGKISIALVALLALVLAAAAGYRELRQREGERALELATPNGIDEGIYLRIGAGEQWITIRGSDRSNPVLLVVHGGPGTALSPLATSFLPYERDWTVVQWDQPGAGKTFGSAGTLPATTTVASIAADGVAVTEFVAARLGQNRVVLLGLSFGSVVGLEMARARPDLYMAYVGTGLFVHRDDGRAIAWQRALERARTDKHADAVAALEAIGPPPYTRPGDTRTLNLWTNALLDVEGGGAVARIKELLFAPRQSLGDVVNYFGGYMASDELFDLGAMDLRNSDNNFALPLVIIQGAQDYDTPVELARSYFDTVTAPSKEFVTLPNGGHMALLYDSASFLAALNAQVLSLAHSQEH